MANFSRAIEMVKERMGGISNRIVDEDTFAANLEQFLKSQFGEPSKQNESATYDELPVYSENDFIESQVDHEHETLDMDTGTLFVFSLKTKKIHFSLSFDIQRF